MREFICDTSPIQYLHQLGHLHLLQRLVDRVTVPPAVISEIDAGRKIGIALPDLKTIPWVAVRAPAASAVLPLVTDLGPGEKQVLALALEAGDAVVILDDALARHVAQMLKIRIKGTLGVLLDAKRAGLIPAVLPILDQLQESGFRLRAGTRVAVLELAGEASPG